MHNENKNPRPASLAFVREIYRWQMNSPHKGPITHKMLPFDDESSWIQRHVKHSIMEKVWCFVQAYDFQHELQILLHMRAKMESISPKPLLVHSRPIRPALPENIKYLLLQKLHQFSLCIYAWANWMSIAPGNGLSHFRRQAVTWTNAGLLSIWPWPLGTNISDIWI